jgi:hypothetical protein
MTFRDALIGLIHIFELKCSKYKLEKADELNGHVTRVQIRCLMDEAILRDTEINFM